MVDIRKREGQQLLVRFPDGSDLRERLDQCAKANKRSLTGEIIHRLEASMQTQPAPDAVSDSSPVRYADFTRLTEKVEWLEGRIESLEKHRV